MKFTLSWLKEHLDTDEPLDALADKLTMIGLEVENIEDKAKALGAFTIARVIEAKQHPNADRLRVCMVDTGSGDPVQVVCGAPNARTGMKGVFSPPGTYIPGKNITLGIGKIRGVESRGMLVSEAEMEFSDDHDGIIDLPADAPVGESYAKWAGLDDPVIEINLTPNRPDCTGVHGIARDLAAADMGKFIDPAIKPVKGAFPSPGDGDARSARTVPRLRAAPRARREERPIARMAAEAPHGDRPAADQRAGRHHQLHDLRPRPAAACVRRRQGARQSHACAARRPGESLLALDGRTYQLDETMCVIADEKGVESLAGIMGGEASGCDENTTDVLIESALWEPLNIAQTGRKLGINSDARYRFERGVDPDFMVPGLELATQMVLDLCGGTPSEITVAGSTHAEDRIIDFPVAEVKRLSGLDVPLTEMKRVLDKLGFFVAGKGETVKVAVPSWRPDIDGKADIVEEIVRIVGVDRVPATPFARGEDARKPVLTAAAGAHPQAPSARSRPRHGRGGDLVVHRQGAGRTVRRRAGRAGARQSDRGRPLRHAAEPHSGAGRERAEECRSRLSRRGAVRGRADLQRRQAGGSAHRRVRRAARARQAERHRPALAAAMARPMRST